MADRLHSMLRSPGSIVLSLVLPYLGAAPFALASPLPGPSSSSSPFSADSLPPSLNSTETRSIPVNMLLDSTEPDCTTLSGAFKETTLRLLSGRGVHIPVPSGYTELHQTFDGGYIVLSYVIAVVGSLCTLELLLRRTSNRGLYNVSLLVAAGICFGAVSTFSMHFIGNNSLSLHHPEQQEKGYVTLTLAYSAGWTILSLVVSCTCMTFAFFVMGLEVDWRGVVRKTGLRRRRRRGDEDSDSDDEDWEREQTDLSQEEKKKELKQVQAKMKTLERKAKVNNVMEKLEWALGWSMVHVPTSVGGNARARRMEDERQAAEEKARKLEEEIKGVGLSPMGKSSETSEFSSQEPDVVQTVASDPVASGYDNQVPAPRAVAATKLANIEVLDVRRGSTPGMPKSIIKLPVPDSAASFGTSSMSPASSSAELLPYRRGSVPAPAPNAFNPPTSFNAPFGHAASSDSLFSPNFSFPAPEASTSRVANAPTVILDTPPLSASAALPSHRYPPLSAIPSHLTPTGGPRRASLPANALNLSPIGRDFKRPSFSLTRINSLPEHDPDDPLTPRSPHDSDDEETQRKEQQMVDDVMASARSRVLGSYSAHSDISPSQRADSRQFNMSDMPRGQVGNDSMASTAALNPPPQPLRRNTRESSAHNSNRDYRHRQRRKTIVKHYSKWQRWLGLDIVSRADFLKILVTGTVTGWGIAGMHYIGQRSIVSFPYIGYNAGMVVASVVIACVAVTVGLYIMFVILRPKLKHGWITKILVACVLGAAVCLMHYCGMGGTTYGLLSTEAPVASAHLDSTSKRLITGLVAALAFLACLCIFTFTVIQQMRHLAHKRQRKRVVVAAMIFDQDDRILVSPDGVIPMVDMESVISMKQAAKDVLKRSKSTKSWDSQSTSSSILDVDLTLAHPAFISALRSTWAWRQPGILPALPQLSSSGGPDGRSSSTEPSSVPDYASQYSSDGPSMARRQSVMSVAESAIYPASSIGTFMPMAQNVGKFLDRFSMTVATLARDVVGTPEGIRRLGVLYDRILTTGHVAIGSTDERKNSVTVAKGQMVFLVRRVTTHHEQSQLLSRNYLFAEPSAVASVMAKVLAVPVNDFTDIMHDQTDFCDFGMTSNVKPGKLYAGLCVIQPTTSEGIQIVVERQRRHQLPMREVCGITSTPFALRSQATHTTGASDMNFTATVEELGEAAQGLAGKSLFDMIAAHNVDDLDDSEPDSLTNKLRNALVEALIPMLDLTFPSKAMAKVLPRLTVTPTLIPLFAPLASTNPRLSAHSRAAPELAGSAHTAWIIMFKAVLAVDTDCSNLDLEPWSLFRAQNECILRDGRESAAALRAAAIAAATANSLSAIPAEVNRGRRPSKVQWMGIGKDSHSPSVPSTPPGLPQVHETPFDQAYFNSPMMDEKVDSPTMESTPYTVTPGLPRGTSVSPHPPLGLPRVQRPKDLSIYIPKPVLRTIVNQAEDDETAAEILPPADLPFSAREMAPGVSYFHPDWLTRMLREDLLPKANEE